MNAMKRVLQNLDDDHHVANYNGTARSESILSYISLALNNRTLCSELGVSDDDGDGIPDTDEGLRCVLDRLYENGLVQGDTMIPVKTIRSVIHRDGKGNYDMGLIVVDAKDVIGFKGEHLRDELEEDGEPLNDADMSYVVTGSPVTRYEMLTAMTGGMMKSIFISIVLSAVFLMLVFGSVRDGAITIIPVVLISTWVFGSMFLLGYSLNVVTVTIAAMTIGVGVDYSIHIRQRYREEMIEGRGHGDSMNMAVEHSGRALLGAAVTTALGFGVLFFSEMRLFSMYGMLSALMIVYAFLGSILILPTLLLLGEGIDPRSLGSGENKRSSVDDGNVAQEMDCRPTETHHEDEAGKAAGM